MKIISKDRIEELHSEPPKAPKKKRDVAVKLVTSEPKPLTKSEKKAEAEARKRKMRLQHIEDERRRRENIKRKRREKKQWQKSESKSKLKSMPKAESTQSLSPVTSTASIVSKQQSPVKQAPSKASAPKRTSKPASTESKSIQQKHATPKASDISIERHAAFERERSYIGQRINQLLSLLRFNITFKLTIGYAFRLLFIFVLLLALIYAAFSYYLFYTGEKRLDENLSYIQAMIQDGTAYDAPLFQAYLAQDHLKLYLYDQSEVLLYESIDETAPVLNQIVAPVTFDLADFPNLPDLWTVAVVDGTTTVHTLALQKDMSYTRSILETTFPIAIVLAIVFMLSSIRAASHMANKQLRPIHTMTQQVQEMSISTRLNVSGTKDELKDLAMTFNKMLDDIQQSYEREKQFVSDASHELRTPIAVIKGYAGMLNRWGKDDPAILEESIQAILGETENMHSLVESLLFIARNDKGTLKMDMLTFSLSELIQEIVKETRLIDTQHDISENITERLIQYGSIDKLKQACRIFIDNSIKYTPENGKINIDLTPKPPYNVLTIADNGIGISKEDLPHIFDRFYRADKSRTKLKDAQHGGTGLGLSIAKIIIEQHGGQIIVESDLNQGTTFTLMLPMQTPAGENGL
ncbi:HAMP domain-containing protein [Fusibacter paucivorans]|uniref:histidine kinase n=1 Tax=Fusibacter paucivorans TaxID=76009 RepID=A0ABS5PPC4_9FIRM|nr:HAMP domain-containing sensor histidine kinase [Fusibacter paucivorans]MBS7527024.1 HAMP domain-containing protein [Fusibacter paucivorans]